MTRNWSQTSATVGVHPGGDVLWRACLGLWQQVRVAYHDAFVVVKAATSSQHFLLGFFRADMEGLR
jgi:hypothetical protein